MKLLNKDKEPEKEFGLELEEEFKLYVFPQILSEIALAHASKYDDLVYKRLTEAEDGD